MIEVGLHELYLRKALPRSPVNHVTLNPSTSPTMSYIMQRMYHSPLEPSEALETLAAATADSWYGCPPSPDAGNIAEASLFFDRHTESSDLLLGHIFNPTVPFAKLG